MGRLKAAVRRLTRVPGVPEARHVTERALAPYLRADLHEIHMSQIGIAARIDQLERRSEEIHRESSDRLDDIDRHLPGVLNAIASTNGTARILRRELANVERSVAALQEDVPRLRAAIAEGDSNVLAEMSTHIDTIGWLLRRLEVVRAEVMNEVRYGSGGSKHSGERAEPTIVDPRVLDAPEGTLKVNLGAGHLPLDGYVNVDMRPLPEIDVVASIDDLPFGPGTLAEISSAHTLEHFPLEELRRRLLPYWVGLLKPGGLFRATVPDMEAMARSFAEGEIGFEAFRSTTYGGQEYEGDFHFNGFTPSTLAELFESAGLIDATVIERGRPNGDCLECEVTGRKPVEP